ncbi:MAG: AIR synthase related protein, partial [Acidimicrobiales bacterium]
GTAATVAEAALNVACSGARPMAVVNCLNFGSPEHPEVMWQLSEAIDGMVEACLGLGLPVIGGNVSLYNESAGVDIDPSPVIGVVGLIERLVVRPPGVSLVPGASLVLLDGGPGGPADPRARPSLGGSRWAREIRGHRNGMLPPLDLAGHARLLWLVSDLVGEGVGGGNALVAGIHDVSGGGLGVALAEMSVRSGTGLRVAGIADHHELFTEAPSRVVVCTTEVMGLVSRAADAGVGSTVLGTAGGDRLSIDGLVDVSVEQTTAAWRERLPALLDEFAQGVSN